MFKNIVFFISFIILAMSLASADSLMTTQSRDSLKYNNSRPSNIPAGAATTNFGNLNVSNGSCFKFYKRFYNESVKLTLEF